MRKNNKEKKKILLSKTDKIIIRVSAAAYITAFIAEQYFNLTSGIISSSVITFSVGIFLLYKVCLMIKNKTYTSVRDKLKLFFLSVFAAILIILSIYWVITEYI